MRGPPEPSAVMAAYQAEVEAKAAAMRRQHSDDLRAALQRALDHIPVLGRGEQLQRSLGEVRDYAVGLQGELLQAAQHEASMRAALQVRKETNDRLRGELTTTRAALEECQRTEQTRRLTDHKAPAAAPPQPYGGGYDSLRVAEARVAELEAALRAQMQSAEAYRIDAAAAADAAHRATADLEETQRTATERAVTVADLRTEVAELTNALLALRLEAAKPQPALALPPPPPHGSSSATAQLVLERPATAAVPVPAAEPVSRRLSVADTTQSDASLPAAMPAMHGMPASTAETSHPSAPVSADPTPSTWSPQRAPPAHVPGPAAWAAPQRSSELRMLEAPQVSEDLLRAEEARIYDCMDISPAPLPGLGDTALPGDLGYEARALAHEMAVLQDMERRFGVQPAAAY